MAPFRLFSGLALTLLLVGMCSSQTVHLAPPAIPPSYETALHHAARTGDITLIQSQLAYGAEPNQRSQDGCKPLLDSASAGQLGAVRALLSGGAGTDITSFFGRTALIESADVRERLGTVLEIAENAGHKEVAKLLRQAEAQTLGRSAGDTACVRLSKRGRLLRQGRSD